MYPPSRSSPRLPAIARAGETSRLAPQRWVLAYELVVPSLRCPLPAERSAPLGPAAAAARRARRGGPRCSRS